MPLCTYTPHECIQTTQIHIHHITPHTIPIYPNPRVKSTEIALEKAAAEVKGSVLASDAFFPFSWGDSVEKACQAGVAAIAHPGGSMRDADAVECCDKYGVVLVTTGVRHFKH